MAKTDLEKQLDQEVEEFNELNANIQQAEQQLVGARQQLSARQGRIQLLQEQIEAQNEKPKPKRKPRAKKAE